MNLNAIFATETAHVHFTINQFFFSHQNASSIIRNAQTKKKKLLEVDENKNHLDVAYNFGFFLCILMQRDYRDT